MIFRFSWSEMNGIFEIMPLLSVFGGLFGDSAGVLFHVWCVLDIR